MYCIDLCMCHIMYIVSPIIEPLIMYLGFMSFMYEVHVIFFKVCLWSYDMFVLSHMLKWILVKIDEVYK